MFKRIWDFLMCRTTDEWCPNIPIIGPLLFYGIIVPIGRIMYGLECVNDWLDGKRNP